MKLAKMLLTMSGFLFATSAMAQGKLEAGDYQLDTAHTKVGFEVQHLVISSVEGRFTNFEGTLKVGDKLEKSSVKASIDVASVNTTNEKRDEHLRSPDFFDAKKFPKMTFESTELSGTNEAFKMTGNLTIKGITKKVTFDGKFLGAVTDPWGGHVAGFSAKTKINRKDFGLTWSKLAEAGPVVGDEVTIDLKVEAKKAAPAAKK